MSERDDILDIDFTASSPDSRDAAQVPRADDAPYLDLITSGRGSVASLQVPRSRAAPDVSYLRLVPPIPEQARDAPARHRRESAVQLALFPGLEVTPSLMAVLDMSCVSDRAFIAMIRDVRPRWLLDLRPAPRFDYGRLTRGLAFRLFAEYGVTYLDIAASLDIRDRNDARLHAGILSQELNELLARTTPTLVGPIVVLLDEPSLVSIAKDVLAGTLEPRPKHGWVSRIIAVQGERYYLV